MVVFLPVKFTDEFYADNRTLRSSFKFVEASEFLVSRVYKE